MNDVWFEPADNTREPCRAGRPAFRKPRRQHLYSVGGERQWPQSPGAKHPACSICGPARETVTSDILKIRMPWAFGGSENVQIPSALGDLVDPAGRVHARR